MQVSSMNNKWPHCLWVTFLLSFKFVFFVAPGLEGKEKADTHLFVNTEEMLQLDSARRLTPFEAVKHKFVTLLFPFSTS